MAKSLNKSLHKASRAKNDEFYTQLGDIANELKHYRDQLRGKVIFCNCDDPFESNFFKYFAANFNTLGAGFGMKAYPPQGTVHCGTGTMSHVVGRCPRHAMHTV